ncbi:branched chain amino acid aminotransferase apoenzyme [Desulfocapsa sulfexigens DSM 10523]|uniref:Branched-chain-amino-acid aminotransferase n=1 Tax=Desulfocapsa sulfexigens (strain DSM 10523 / SB164P1) TaxID=1167006 RepID=M1P8F3_DESSD|nr:branched-chain amino acid aminotransferase [Desulfocapsa sulfexigens]AGF77937.1 branched chain amino acid aminotransferase apoenzyme [Desulfocapsa sulfexigens DSM 10523]
MWKDLDISVVRCDSEKRKDKPDQKNLGFGKFFTDHMFLMKWDRENGWHNAEICPYQNFSMDPAAMVYHYGQAIFEGLKAYKGENDQIYMFRPEDNLERMNSSALRMCMPRIPVDKVLKGIKALVYLDRDWIPSGDGATLYLRPTMVAVEPALGVRPSSQYYFFVIMSPVGAYYAEGFNPTKIWVTDKYVRAVKGGVGHVKTAGNYAASIMAAEEAHRAGYTQVLWLDACERKYIEEVGTSNIFFKIGEDLITPPLNGSILGGITRDSVIQLARSWGVNVIEKQITIDEVLAAIEDGSLKEAFGSGTAAVIAPIGELCYQEKKHVVADGKTGELSQRLFDELQAIQNGRQDDPFKWIVRVG